MKFARGDTKSMMNMEQFIDELRKSKPELYLFQRRTIKEVEKLYNLGYHDQLTGVYNRNKLEELREYFDKTQCTVVMVDINYLKTYNDTFGHESGDSIIRAVANELHWKFKNVYRLGGDEFLIVTEHIGGISEALDDISTKCFTIAYGLYVKSSMQPLAVAMKIADERMYQDKHDKKMRANRIL